MKTQNFIFLIFVCFALMTGCTKDNILGDEPTEMNLKKATIGAVFMVEPNGVDDTDNLRNTFVDADNAGKGSVVQLVEGTYHLNFIEIREFYGKFKGAGKGKTVVTTVGDLDVDALLSQNLNLVLIRFVGGDVHMSDMTLKTPPGDLGTGTWYGINGLAGFSAITAQYTSENEYINAVVNNVEFLGHKENILNGLLAESGFQSPPPELIPLSNIDISVTNCSFEGFRWYGALIMEIKEGKIIAGTKNNGNIFKDNWVGLGIWHNVSVKALVEGNTFSVEAGAGWGLQLNSSPWLAALQQEPQTFTSVVNILQNEFNIPGGFGGMLIKDVRRGGFHEESPMLIQTKNNLYNMSNNAFTGIGCVFMSGAVIRNNSFKGSGSYGVRILGAPYAYGENENGLMLGNNFSNSSYSVATVYLNAQARDWTIVGGNLGEDVIDQGTNNIITGFNNNTSEVPTGQTIVDNLEEMRKTLKNMDDY